jgi:hypothetical protein
MKRIAVARSLVLACFAAGAQPISGPDLGYAPVPDVSRLPGKALGQFGEAHFIALSPKAEIYVADTLNWRGQKFTPRSLLVRGAEGQR